MPEDGGIDMKYIAVFGKKKHFEDLIKVPKEKFIHINRSRNVVARLFDGIIYLNAWYEEQESRDANDLLKERQPELFIK